MRNNFKAVPSKGSSTGCPGGLSGKRLRQHHARTLARVVFVATVLSLVLYACGGNSVRPSTSQTPPQSQASAAPAPVSPPPQDSNGTYTETTIGASGQGQADQNATASQIMLPGLPYGDSDAESHDLQATACIHVKDYMGKSMQELQDILHKMVQKKLVVSALSSGADDAAMAKLAPHVDDSLLSGLIIDKEGYYNGDGFGMLCVDARGKLSQALMAQYQKKRLELKDFCYSNTKYADNVLRPYAMTAALRQLALRQDARLGDLSISELREFMSQITVSNEKLNIKDHQLCLDIVADYDPMQARRTLQSYVMEATKEEARDKAAPLQLAHYSLFLDLAPYPVGQPLPDFGEALSVAEGSLGKALALTGTKSGWAEFTALSETGKTSPNKLENQGKVPAPQALFSLNGHPIGDFNATIKIESNLKMTPADSPLQMDLFHLEYQNYVIGHVVINLTMDKNKLKHISYILDQARTDPMPFDWGSGPVSFTLQRQKDVLKLFVNQNFIISTPTAPSPLYSLSVNMTGGKLLYALQMEAQQAPPQPQPPKGVAGMIPHSSKWTTPQIQAPPAQAQPQEAVDVNKQELEQLSQTPTPQPNQQSDDASTTHSDSQPAATESSTSYKQQTDTKNSASSNAQPDAQPAATESSTSDQQQPAVEDGGL